jgi:rhamnopyranosyl-N-acetylglucosaminyl-diphospho-decaprenol beta-1,3/1,4-galactofuranosyltransferase
VLAADGSFHPFNRPWPDARRLEDVVAAAEQRLVKIRYASFVSMLVSSRAVERHGLPFAEFFIWLDDVEYSARVLRDASGYLVPDSLVHHKSPIASSSAGGPRYYYALRNTLWMLRGGAFDRRDLWVRLRLSLAVPRGIAHHLRATRFAPSAFARVAKALVAGLGDLPR